MTVKELKAIANSLPETLDNMDVMIVQANEEFRFSLANEAGIEPVRFECSSVPKKNWPTVDCLVIRD